MLVVVTMMMWRRTIRSTLVTIKLIMMTKMKTNVDVKDENKNKNKNYDDVGDTK